MPNHSLLPLFASLAVATIFISFWLVPQKYASGSWPVVITGLAAVCVSYLFLDGTNTLGLGASPFTLWLLPQIFGIVLTVYIVKGVLIDLLAYRWLNVPTQDFSEAELVFQNPRLLTKNLAEGWTAAVFEELIFRGFLQTAIAQIASPLGIGMSITLATTIPALLFGISHKSQGFPGILTATSVGFCFGAWFHINGGNLWPMMLAHGLINSVSYVGHYFISPNRLKGKA